LILALPADYEERVYAGVLGKIIGVYLGRPFEGWSYARIMAQLGEINYYVNDRLDAPLVVVDDDITGTFTFLRALPDYGHDSELTPAQIGQTWLNYIVEQRSILWWGGMGRSTEHTAFLRLKQGIPAPQSGSMALNGKLVAEQIGAQIFIDGWALVAPGDPAFAADLARRAARVSHDGEAVYGAQVIAAMASLAFIEADINKLMDTAVALIPQEAVIYRMIDEIRHWHAAEPDWRATRAKIVAHYGYDKYGGNCHIVPNHALIILALLYGDDDFQKSLMIVNTSGWDTDCNSGNLGCLLGIKNGLAGLAGGPDWRTPVADRMYLPTADGGSAITDALTETYKVVNIGRALQGREPVAPKQGARYHFDLPGAVQGFQPEDERVTVSNVAGFSASGQRSLALHYSGLVRGRPGRVATATFLPSPATADYSTQRGYPLLASPTLYPGQTVKARLVADPGNERAVRVRLFARHYDEDGDLQIIGGPAQSVSPGRAVDLEWPVGDCGGWPIAWVGVEVGGDNGARGTLYLDTLTWAGPPDMTLNRPYGPRPEGQSRGPEAVLWKKAWVNGLDGVESFYATESYPQPYRLIQNAGRGLLIQGTREWKDYQVSARLTPHLCRVGGLAVRVQGLKRFYALLLDRENVRLVRALDGDTVLAEIAGGWAFDTPYDLHLRVVGNQLTGSINGRVVIEGRDPDRALTGGGLALVCVEGHIVAEDVAVRPVSDG
jgi:ADP-ribosylglycohydrolase